GADPSALAAALGARPLRGRDRARRRFDPPRARHSRAGASRACARPGPGKSARAVSAPVITPMTEADVDDVLAIDLASFHAGDLAAREGDPRAARDKQLREELVRPWARLRVARDASCA